MELILLMDFVHVSVRLWHHKYLFLTNFTVFFSLTLSNTSLSICLGQIPNFKDAKYDLYHITSVIYEMSPLMTSLKIN